MHEEAQKFLLSGWRKIWKIFRVLSEMRGKNQDIDPKNWNFRDKIGCKCRHRLCQNLKFRFLKNSDSRKMQNRHLTTSKKYKIGTSKPEIGLRFGIFDSKINFLKSKIDFSNSSRILLRDLKIWNQRCRKPLNLHFRFKIPIFASNFSSTKILILC